MTRHPVVRTALATAVLLGLLLPGCGDSSTPTSPTATTRGGISFTPAVSPPPSGSIALTLRGSTAEELSLTLIARDVENLYGFALDLVFNPAVISFESSAQLNFLAQGGVGIATEVAENPEGRVVIGQSRLGEVPGVSGSGELLGLTFRAVAAGTTGLSPDNAAAFGPDGETLPVRFFGGTVRVGR